MLQKFIASLWCIFYSVDGRRLMDIRAKLQMNAKNQKEAQIKSELLQMERKGNISNERLMVPIFCKTHCKIL